MTTKQVAQMVESIGVPFAYYEFEDDTAREPPFVCFMFTESDDMMADNVNFTDTRTLVIELYTAAKDYDLEATVRGVLQSHNLPYRADFARIDGEKLYITTFTTEVLINGQ